MENHSRPELTTNTVIRKDWNYNSIRKKIIKYISLSVFLILVIYTSLSLDVRWDRVGSLREVWSTLIRFWPPETSFWLKIGKPILETFLMAFLGTAISAVFSVPVIILSARNIQFPLKKLAYLTGRLIIIISRSVHELVWALIFVTAVGLGSFAGVLALSVRSVGFISKLMAETIEDIDEGQIEAIKATGANTIQIWVYGIIPQIIPTLIGVLVFRADVNLRASTILGVVGAGGIGYMLNLSMKTYHFDRTSAIIIVIVLIVSLGEYSSARLREKYVSVEV